jgi:hypothetical protein
VPETPGKGHSRFYREYSLCALRESGVIVVTGNRADALARLDVFVGEWVVEARFPGGQPAAWVGIKGAS